MKHTTLIEVITPFGEGMYHWKKMNRPFHIGSSITCFFKNGGIEVRIHPEKKNETVYQISPQEWLKGHEFSIADGFKVKFKGKNFETEWKHGKHVEWDEFEIGKSGFIAAAVLLGVGTYLMPKDEHSKVPEIEEVATIRLTTGESGLVAFKPSESGGPSQAAAPSEAASAAEAAVAAPSVAAAPAVTAAPAAKEPAKAEKKKAAAAPVAAVAPEPNPVNQAFSSKNGGKNQAGASVAKVPAPNAAALLLSRRMASLQKGLQKVMSNPAGGGAVESTGDSAPSQTGARNTSSLAKSISTSESSTGGSVYGGMKNGSGSVTGTGTGNGSLSGGGNNFEIKGNGGRGNGGGSGIQLVQTTAPQVSGGTLNVAVIQKTFQKNMSQLRNCYEAANIKTASIKINLEFTITKNGGVTSQKVLQGPDRQPASFEQKQLENCILNRMTAWTFDTGNMSSNVVIEYPLTFRSLTAGDE